MFISPREKQPLLKVLDINHIRIICSRLVAYGRVTNSSHGKKLCKSRGVQLTTVFGCHVAEGPCRLCLSEKSSSLRSSTDIEVATKPSVVEAPPSVQILAHHREHAKRVVSFEIIDRIEN